MSCHQNIRINSNYVRAWYVDNGEGNALFSRRFINCYLRKGVKMKTNLIKFCSNLANALHQSLELNIKLVITKWSQVHLSSYRLDSSHFVMFYLLEVRSKLINEKCLTSYHVSLNLYLLNLFRRHSWVIALAFIWYYEHDLQSGWAWATFSLLGFLWFSVMGPSQ